MFVFSTKSIKVFTVISLYLSRETHAAITFESDLIICFRTR